MALDFGIPKPGAGRHSPFVSRLATSATGRRQGVDSAVPSVALARFPRVGVGVAIVDTRLVQRGRSAASAGFIAGAPRLLWRAVRR
jgi:hypothetical protein